MACSPIGSNKARWIWRLAVGQADRPAAGDRGHHASRLDRWPGFLPRHDQPIPLVVLGPQCIFRKRAIQLLEQADKPCGSPLSSPVWRDCGPHRSAAWAHGAVCARNTPALAASEQLFAFITRHVPNHVHASGERASAGVERLRAIIRDEIAPPLSHELTELGARCGDRWPLPDLPKYLRTRPPSGPDRVAIPIAYRR